MYAFTYHRAASIKEAEDMLAGNPDARLLAGGQTLLPTLKQHLASPSALVDIGHIAALRFIRAENDGIAIGAATRHAEVAASGLVRERIPALAHLAGLIGDPHVRNAGTLGGSIANNDPAADYPAACLALGAAIRTNRREIAADDFFTGLFSTALDEGEIVTEVLLPAPKRAGYAKFPHPASRYALAGVFAAQTAGGVRVAATGAGADGVFRLQEMEAALEKSWGEAALADARPAAGAMLADLHADKEYRAHLVHVMAHRAVAAA